MCVLRRGRSSTAVTAQLGVSRGTVIQWRVRFLGRRLDGLGDEPQPGMPRTISDAPVEEVAVRTLEEVPKGPGRFVLAARRALAGPVWQREEPLIAHLDPGEVLAARRLLDPVGRYHRPDVFRLQVDSSPVPRSSRRVRRAANQSAFRPRPLASPSTRHSLRAGNVPNPARPGIW